MDAGFAGSERAANHPPAAAAESARISKKVRIEFGKGMAFESWRWARSRWTQRGLRRVPGSEWPAGTLTLRHTAGVNALSNESNAGHVQTRLDGQAHERALTHGSGRDDETRWNSEANQDGHDGLFQLNRRCHSLRRTVRWRVTFCAAISIRACAAMIAFRFCADTRAAHWPGRETTAEHEQKEQAENHWRGSIEHRPHRVNGRSPRGEGAAGTVCDEGVAATTSRAPSRAARASDKASRRLSGRRGCLRLRDPRSRRDRSSRGRGSRG